MFLEEHPAGQTSFWKGTILQNNHMALNSINQAVTELGAEVDVSNLGYLLLCNQNQ